MPVQERHEKFLDMCMFHGAGATEFKWNYQALHRQYDRYNTGKSDHGLAREGLLYSEVPLQRNVPHASRVRKRLIF